MVANKIDKDPLVGDRADELKKAKTWADEHHVNFMDVSASEFTRVRKLFREVFETILVEGTGEFGPGFLWAPGQFGVRGDDNQESSTKAGGSLGGWLGGFFG